MCRHGISAVKTIPVWPGVMTRRLGVENMIFEVFLPIIIRKPVILIYGPTVGL